MKRKIGVILLFALIVFSFAAYSFAERSDNARVTLATIYFKSGSAQLNPQNEKDLEKALAALKADATVGLQIEGYSDNPGALGKNREISQERARTVRQWFLKRGVDAIRLMIKNHDDSQADVQSRAPTEPSLNGRVEIVRSSLKLPLAYLPSARYEFTPVVEGQAVTHNFVIQNKGEGLLEVQRVKTD